MDDLADACRALDGANGWVANADTKAGLLSGAVAVEVAAVTQQASSIEAARGSLVAAGLFGCLVVTLVAAVVALAGVVIPRTPRPRAGSRLGLGALSSSAWERPPLVDRTEAAAEAWGEAHVVGKIAARKYRALKIAAGGVFAALPAYVGWVVAATGGVG